DAVAGQLAAQVGAHRVVPVGRHAGGQVRRHAGVVRLPVRVGGDRLGVGVERVDDDLQLGVLLRLLQDANVLVVVGEHREVVGPHHADDGADTVRELPPLLPVAVGGAAAGRVFLARVGAAFVDL